MLSPTQMPFSSTGRCQVERALHHLYQSQEGPQAKHSMHQGQGSQLPAGNLQDTELLQPSKVALVDPCDVVAIELPAERRGKD